MKNAQVPITVIFAIILGFLLGRTTLFPNSPALPQPVLLAEGIIWSVEFHGPDGKTNGLARGSDAIMVPGGNGSWNMDIYGRLYETHLEITYLNQPNSGLDAKIVPFSQIVRIQFGDGGRKTVSQN